MGNHPGYVYLIHFDRAYKHARHYMGWAAAGRLEARVAEELAGNSRAANLMRVVVADGIRGELARTWRGGRAEERRLKNLRNAPHLCPVCSARPWPARARDSRNSGDRRPPWWPDPGAPRRITDAQRIGAQVMAASAHLEPPF